MDEITIKKLFGKRIKQLRKNSKLTQFKLGEKVGIDQRQIAYIEGGNCFPTLKTLNKFAEIFDCPIKELFNYEHLIEQKNMKTLLVNKVSKMNDKNLKMFHQIINILETHLS